MALRKSEDQLLAIINNTEPDADFRAIFDSSMDMIISVDADRNIVEFNPAAEKTFGYKKEEILGKHINLLYADPSNGLQTYEKTKTAGGFTSEIVNKRKNGETFTSFLSSTVLRDENGAITGHMGISRDITEQKRAEVALLESKEREPDWVQRMLI